MSSRFPRRNPYSLYAAPRPLNRSSTSTHTTSHNNTTIKHLSPHHHNDKQQAKERSQEAAKQQNNHVRQIGMPHSSIGGTTCKLLLQPKTTHITSPNNNVTQWLGPRRGRRVAMGRRRRLLSCSSGHTNHCCHCHSNITSWYLSPQTIVRSELSERREYSCQDLPCFC